MIPNADDTTKHVFINVNDVDSRGITATRVRGCYANIQNTPHEPKQRVITKSAQWSKYKLNHVDQSTNSIESFYPDTIDEFMRSQIRKKIEGYRYQDTAKNKYSTDSFITMEEVCAIVRESEGQCFYCQRLVQFVYTYVREPSQWTLDRIDNSIGHNSGNVLIACLSCNLKRRCLRADKYKFTRQMVLVKMD